MARCAQTFPSHSQLSFTAPAARADAKEDYGTVVYLAAFGTAAANANDNNLLGKFHLNGIPPAPRGVLRSKVVKGVAVLRRRSDGWLNATKKPGSTNGSGPRVGARSPEGGHERKKTNVTSEEGSMATRSAKRGDQASGPTMEVGDDDGDADAIGEDDNFSEMLGEGESRDSSPRASEDGSITSSPSDAFSRSWTPSPYDSPADGPSGGNGAAIMKIPTFAFLVLSNVFGFSTSDSCDQSALINIDIGSQPYAPEPAIKDLPDCDDKDIHSNLVDSTYDFLVVGAGAGGGPPAPRLAAEGNQIRRRPDLVSSLSRSHRLHHPQRPTNLIPHKWDFEQLQNMFNDETWVGKAWLSTTPGSKTTFGFEPVSDCQSAMAKEDGEHPAAPDLLVDLVTAILTGREPVVNEDYKEWRNDEAQGGSWITLTKQANGTRPSVRSHGSPEPKSPPSQVRFRVLGYPVSKKFPGQGKGIERVRRWYAKKEVILSAAPFEAPRLLMHSGIGDCDYLKKYNIKPLVHPLGVGQNLQDRVEETTTFTLKKPHVVFQNSTFGYDPAKGAPRSAPLSASGMPLEY
ncbi:hypothetical protein FRC00_009440 [Tulasnella sp. 408]|nr:hypothetical protein FRC00_009440 [Tulasnella sp. 408]